MRYLLAIYLAPAVVATALAGGCQRGSGSTGTGTGGAGGAPTTGDAGEIPCAPLPDPTQPAAALADTGCMDKTNVTRFAASAWAYEVNSPLWSDLADKSRAFVLPPGGKIKVASCTGPSSGCLDAADDGKWSLPAGTILLKNFGFDGKIVETRLLVAMPDATWVGYSYQWNEAQTAATLVPSPGASITFNTGARAVDWTYPSRRDCNECHTRSAGWSLGLETAQMNRVPVSAALGTQNQIDRFAAAGLFEAAPAKPYKAALVTPYQGQLGGPSSSATLTERARSYLHANCAFCHRPDGEFKTIDLRYDIDFKHTSLCNSVPVKGTQNVDGATNLTPGHPELSVTWLRMNTLDLGRMPPLASYVLDQDALALVGDWIRSIDACP
jgi:uncharacterized repeat protein (TIGR03806 family)